LCLPSAESVRPFWPLIKPAICARHAAAGRDPKHPPETWLPESDARLKIASLVACRFEVVRNLSGFPFRPAMTAEDFAATGEALIEALADMEGDFSGVMYQPGSGTAGQAASLALAEAEVPAEEDSPGWPRGRALFVGHYGE